MSNFKTIQLNCKAVKSIKDGGNRCSKGIGKATFIIKKNPVLFILTLLLLVGIIIGSVLAKDASENLINSLDFIFMNNYKLRNSSSLLEVFTSSIVSSSVFLFITILMGLSMWGVAAIPFLCLLKGIGIGIASGYLYMTYGLSGFFFNLLIILPGTFLSSLALIICSKHSISFSYMVFAKGFPLKKKSQNFYGVKKYMTKIYKCFFIIGISSLIDVLFNRWFSGVFNF